MLIYLSATHFMWIGWFYFRNSFSFINDWQACCPWGAESATQRAEKVHKPPLRVNVINFELDLMHQYGSLGVPQTPNRCEALMEVAIQIHKMCVKSKNKLHSPDFYCFETM